ncbi:TerD family protein [Streptomyces sp. CdTB01]|uniref:TerD family protein n=1 Tax=Streptomyces sp. CdTB01 TaxID=1725411 RepID=UPI00099E5627
MSHITKGANTPVPAGPLRVAVCRRDVAGTPAVDASALLLDAAGKVRGDADLVFYNQPAHPSGAVRHTGGAEGGGMLAEWLEIDLPRVEPEIQRVLIAGSCDGGVFGQVPGLYVQALTAEGTVVAHYAVTDASSETAFVLGEFYRRDGQWKFRAVGQGYDSGLAGLATDFGIAVSDEAPGREPAPQAPATPPPSFSFGPDFPPHVQRGRGNGVVTVEVPLPPGPVVVEAWHEGEGYFGMHTLDRRNKHDDLVYNTTLRDFRGRALVRPPRGRPLRLSVEADHDWTVLVQPLSVARVLGPGPLQGYGPEVVAYGGPAADLDVEFAGDEDGGGYFGLWYHEKARLDDPDADELLVNATDPLRQTVPVPDGPLLVIMEADGPWQLAARPVPVFAEPQPQPQPAPLTGAPESRSPLAKTPDGDTPDGDTPDGDTPVAGTPVATRPVAKVTTAPGLHQGRGEETITLVNPRPGRPALVRYDLRDTDSPYSPEVKSVDEYGDEDTWLSATLHGTRGVTMAFCAGEAEQTVRVACRGAWTLHLLPEEDAPLITGPAEGKGSAVLRYEGPPTLMAVRRTSLGKNERLAAHARNHPFGKSVIIVDTDGRRRPALGTVFVDPGGTCFVQVGAREGTNWRLEPRPLDEATPLGARTQGSGYGVVHHTGPERDLVLAGRSFLYVYELDENLFPTRTITPSSGPVRVSSGIFQVRSLGDWVIELRD